MRSKSSQSLGERRRVALIAGAIVLIMVFTIIGVFATGSTKTQTLSQDPGLELSKDMLYHSAGTWDEIQARKSVASGKRSLNSFYARRAYPGAPPTIPHKVDMSNKSIPGNCLNCHKNGEFSPKFNAYAPKTPHPEYINCRQCHVPQVEGLFRPTNWEKPKGPKLHQKGLRSSPPVIPHELSLRENCAACHTGPSAVKEIRTSHPERVNCVQCHVPKQNNDFSTFQRAK